MKLHQYDLDHNSAYCLDAPECEEQFNLLEKCDRCSHNLSRHIHDMPGEIGPGECLSEAYTETGVCYCEEFKFKKKCPECYRTGDDCCSCPSECAFRGKSISPEELEKEELKRIAEIKCSDCGHEVGHHSALVGCREILKQNEQVIYGPCGCPKVDFTKDEQSSSYYKSDQSELSDQSQELQSTSHSQYKSPHDHTAEDQQIHTENTPESSLRALLDLVMERFFQISLVLSKSSVAECLACHKLVEQALNNLLLGLENSHPKHMESHLQQLVEQARQLLPPGSLDRIPQVLRKLGDSQENSHQTQEQNRNQQSD